MKWLLSYWRCALGNIALIVVCSGIWSFYWCKAYSRYWAEELFNEKVNAFFPAAEADAEPEKVSPQDTVEEPKYIQVDGAQFRCMIPTTKKTKKVFLVMLAPEDWARGQETKEAQECLRTYQWTPGKDPVYAANRAFVTFSAPIPTQPPTRVAVKPSP